MKLAKDAMVILRWFEINLINYQIELQTLQAVSIFTNAKKIIDELWIVSDIWEILSLVPLTIVDHVASQTISIETTTNGEKVRQVLFRDRLNWN